MHHSHAIGSWAVSCDSCFLFLSPWLNLDWQGQCLPGAWKWGGIFFFSAARAMMWILIRLAALLYGSAAIAVIAVAAAAAMSPERLPQWEMLSLKNPPPPAGSLVDILTFLHRSHTNTRRRRRSLWMRISCLLQSWLKTSAECARCSVAMGYAPS